MGGRPDRDGAAVQAAVWGVQPRQDRAVRAEERELPGDALPGTPRAPRRGHTVNPSPAPLALLVAGRKGWLDNWADYAENQLNLNVRRGIITQLLLRGLVYVGAFSHINLLALSAFAYAALEATEGVGLAMRRRWAGYLTV